MNLFRLHDNPVRAAQMQCDTHVIKMTLETAQMLSTAHRLYGTLDHPDLYKATHSNHPSTKWVCETSGNYEWAYQHFLALGREYTHRYGKTHLSVKKLSRVLANVPSNIPVGPQTTQSLAMKHRPECMFPDDPVKSYRLYYFTKRHDFEMTWKNRPVPPWFIRMAVRNYLHQT